MKKWSITAVLLSLLLLFSACTAPAAEDTRSIDAFKAGLAEKEKHESQTEETENTEDTENTENQTQAPKPQLETKPSMEKPSDPEPENEEDPAVFAPLVGVWYEETGNGFITIYENGGFRLSDNSGDYDGYLVYSEEEENQWISGPHYVLYDEGNERMFDAVLMLDENIPNAIVYAVSAGAVLYYNEPVAEFSSEAHVFVDWAEGSQGTFFDEIEVVLDETEPQAKILLWSDMYIQDFSILSLTLEDISEEGEVTFSWETLYTREALEEGQALIVTTCFYGDTPNVGISFTDENGNIRFFAVDMSGEDGSLYLWEFMPY